MACIGGINGISYDLNLTYQMEFGINTFTGYFLLVQHPMPPAVRLIATDSDHVRA